MVENIDLIRSVRVGNCNYSVDFVSRKRLSKKSGDNRAVGLIDNDKNKIYILKNMSDDNKLITLWHEIFHAVLVQRCLDGSKYIDEEELVDNSAQAIIQIIRDNPFLIDITSVENVNIFKV